MIRGEQLSKYYGSVRAIADVSFGVAAGEVAALLGPNGAGKSTVMRLLTGYVSPTAGRALVGDVDVAERPVTARRQIGYLPEQVSLYPEFTVRRYLGFVGEVKGLARRRRRAAIGRVIEQCGLGEVADRHNGTLSKGYRQRVGLAQALLGDPAVLVLDEPTVGLDPVQAVEMRELIRTLAGCTVLLSTHNLTEASALCSRVIILSQGRLVAADTAAELGRRLEGTGRLVVRIDGPPDAVAQGLSALPGVLAIERGEPDGQAGVRFVVLASNPEPVQRRLAAMAVAAGWTLLEVQVKPPTLEDLFVRLVGSEP